MTQTIDLQQIKKLRQDIHKHPEVSGEEEQTARSIEKFISQYNPDKIVTGIGGHGLIAQFKGKEEGPSITIRAELDALPIQEINELNYRSEEEGKGHLCGHDGHMAMVAALAQFLGEERPKRGAVNLLFQPAEETGQGAQAMLDDEKFGEIKHDYIFALHNLPGYKKNKIIIKEGVFAAASKGLIVELNGKTSHAAEPENGISPAPAIAELILKIKKLPEVLEDLKDFSLITIVHLKIGDRAFGTSPGHGVLMATLRAYRDEDLKTLDENAKKISREISDRYNLECEISDTEIFSSTLNQDESVKMIEKAVEELNLDSEYLDKPFRWSEDFGLFSQKYKGALFGLGSGEDTPSLHNPDYDFPDDIAETGINMFKSLIKQLVY